MPNIYRFQQNDIVNDTQKVGTSTWTNNINNLTGVFSSSVQANFTSPTSSGAFFIDLFNEHTSSSTSVKQFSVAYAHKNGSGSLNFTNDVGAKGKSATGVTYAQYRNLVFGDELTNFTFNDFTPNDFYIININRARYKHNLKPGTLNLFLTGSGAPGVGGPINQSGIKTLHLTDDSVTATGSATITNIGRQFNIVSGASGVRQGANTTQVVGSGSYGLFYPDAGLIFLNTRAISQSLEIEPSQGDNATPNGHQTLYNAIKHGNGLNTSYFIIDSEEKISSQFYFVRARNEQFNYTTNPSFTDNTGTLNNDSFIDNPTTFITTIGLYNDANDLVAVAKVSQPIAKDFTKEALMRVKLDY
jgi:hypothetical protein